MKPGGSIAATRRRQLLAFGCFGAFIGGLLMTIGGASFSSGESESLSIGILNLGFGLLSMLCAGFLFAMLIVDLLAQTARLEERVAALEGRPGDLDQP